MEGTSIRSRRGQFYDNIKCWEMPFRSNLLPLWMLFFYFLEYLLLPFEVVIIRNELCSLMFSHHSFGRLISLLFLPSLRRVSVDFTYSLAHDIIFSSFLLLLKMMKNAVEVVQILVQRGQKQPISCPRPKMGTVDEGISPL